MENTVKNRLSEWWGHRGGLPPFNPFGLRMKLTVFFGLLFLLTVLTASALSLSQQKRFLSQELEKRADLLARNLAATAGEAVQGRDFSALSALIGTVQKEDAVLYAAVVDHRDVVLMHSDVNRISLPFVPSTTEVSAPIRHGGRSIGRIVLGINRAPVDRLLARAEGAVHRVLGLGLVLGVAGTLFFSGLFLRPVSALSRATERVATGDLDVEVPLQSRDELGRLGLSFNVMTHRLRAAYEDVERGYLEMTRALAAAIESKDPYTQGHCSRVHRYALALGRSLGLSRYDLRELELASILHDIGKIGVKDDILLKGGRLTLEETRLLRLHPEMGKRILETVAPLRPVADYILAHHEHYDGRGYPRGLEGEKIPFLSRVLAVVDSYDSMTSNRPYRNALSEAEALRRLWAGKGRQFDPAVLEAFLALYDDGVIGALKAQPLTDP